MDRTRPPSAVGVNPYSRFRCKIQEDRRNRPRDRTRISVLRPGLDIIKALRRCTNTSSPSRVRRVKSSCKRRSECRCVNAVTAVNSCACRRRWC